MTEWVEDAKLLRICSKNFRLTDNQRLNWIHETSCREIELIIAQGQIPPEELFNTAIFSINEIERRKDIIPQIHEVKYTIIY